ncbi:transposase [Lactobacillus colini]|uniref:Transposase n=1 Tax=Lactobacillus colini TaxID=1819254 RepID=A0ABS4MEP1_9LACO|nr:IS66 family insertion sequence element accessory protein TnpB [Lactobacillus colini]MBP2058093.1 transposase [Lactobacillus colini]
MVELFNEMINLPEFGQVYIACGNTDMRRGIDSLCLIKEDFERDITYGEIFLFCKAKQDRFKEFYWNSQGF